MLALHHFEISILVLELLNESLNKQGIWVRSYVQTTLIYKWFYLYSYCICYGLYSFSAACLHSTRIV